MLRLLLEPPVLVRLLLVQDRIGLALGLAGQRVANAALHDAVLLHRGLLPGLHALGLELHGGGLPVVGAQQGGSTIRRPTVAAVTVAGIELRRSGASQPEHSAGDQRGDENSTIHFRPPK